MTGHSSGVPLLGFTHWPGPTATAVRRWTGKSADDHPPRGVHAHDFLVLLYVARGRWPRRGGGRERAAVFARIEARFHGNISLRDVAAAAGLTPGHLTTVVGRRTGRTVQQWITERRMREARRLLAHTDLTVAEIGTRVGYRDP